MIRTPTPAVLDRFDALCEAVQDGGNGITLSQIGDAHALARELEKPEPDPERVELFRGRLGLEPEVVKP